MATIVTTDGFAVFQNRQKLSFFRRLAAERGLILLTDSDGAGFMIRNFLKGAIPPEQLKQAYVPDVYGKERRKRRAGKEGKLGVEGMKPEVLLRALREAGATLDGCAGDSCRAKITKSRPVCAGPFGGRKQCAVAQTASGTVGFARAHERDALLDALNVLMDREQLECCCAELFETKTE